MTPGPETTRRGTMRGISALVGFIAGVQDATTPDPKGPLGGFGGGPTSLTLGDWQLTIAHHESDVSIGTRPTILWALAADEIQTYTITPPMSTLSDDGNLTVLAAETIADARIDRYPTLVIATRDDEIALIERGG